MCDCYSLDIPPRPTSTQTCYGMTETNFQTPAVVVAAFDSPVHHTDTKGGKHNSSDEVASPPTGPGKEANDCNVIDFDDGDLLNPVNWPVWRK